MQAAEVFYNGRLAGVLAQTADGFSFTYDGDYLAGGTPISFTLPLQEAPFHRQQLHGFFDNLVSEGWLRSLQAREQKIDENNKFALLLANGRDLSGAVSVIPL